MGLSMNTNVDYQGAHVQVSGDVSVEFGEDGLEATGDLTVSRDRDWNGTTDVNTNIQFDYSSKNNFEENTYIINREVE